MQAPAGSCGEGWLGGLGRRGRNARYANDNGYPSPPPLPFPFAGSVYFSTSFLDLFLDFTLERCPSRARVLGGLGRSRLGVINGECN